MINRGPNSLEQLFESNENLHVVLQTVLDGIAQKRFEMSAPEVLEILTAGLAPLGLNVERMASGNNTLFKIAYQAKPGEHVPDDKVVLQISEQVEEADAALQELLKRRDRLPWLAGMYHPLRSVTNERMTYSYHIIGVEFCPVQLKDRIAALRDDDDYGRRIALATSVAVNLERVLDDLTALGLIWTDLKHANLLFREDGSIVIADTKAIIDPKKIPTRDRQKTLILRRFTEAYLSESFVRDSQLSLGTVDELKLAMEREYSYQIATLLHMIATGSEEARLSKQRPNAADRTEFDFSHPVFKTPKGARLQFIISCLASNDSMKRFDFHKATQLLNAIDDEAAFDRVLKEGGIDVKHKLMRSSKGHSSADIGTFRKKSPAISGEKSPGTAVQKKSPAPSAEKSPSDDRAEPSKRLPAGLKSLLRPVSIPSSPPVRRREERDEAVKDQKKGHNRAKSDIFAPPNLKPLSKSSAPERDKPETPRRKGGSHKGSDKE